MTNQPSRRTLMRGLIEDPGYDHARDVGRILHLPDETRGMHQWLVDAVQTAEGGHPGNLLAQTKVAPRPLNLWSTFDPVSWSKATGQLVVVVQEGEYVIPASAIIPEPLPAPPAKEKP